MMSIGAERLRKEGWILLLAGLIVTAVFAILTNLHLTLQVAPPTFDFALNLVHSVMSVLIQAAALLVVVGVVFVRLGRSGKPESHAADE